ncbi:hypothetical protein OC846_004915 [Tilletia horrida]|uniref:Uncharacterized protein n=1 Tax=Tilletia horrida TaxID=155126 RepID=A0AAN6GMT9_9BASI|nr:hypothetical protein OC846_004915 [Tilletia horrida]
MLVPRFRGRNRFISILIERMLSRRAVAATAAAPSPSLQHQQQQQCIRLVLFDAFDTLARPRQPPHIQYADQARALGLHWASSSASISEQNEAIRIAMKQAFKHTLAEHPRYGIDTGLATPSHWWSLLIRRTFQHLPALSSTTSQDLNTTMNSLTSSLLARFASAQAYQLFPDVLPTLRAFQEHLPQVQLGIASNSDPAILRALGQLGLGSYLNLDPAAAVDDDDERKPSSSNPLSSPPPTLSYTSPAEKPHPAFFLHALENAQSSQQHNQSAPIHPSQALYIGDQLHEDYFAAKDAGLRALWLHRPEHASNVLVSQSAREGTVAGERGAAEPGDQIKSLEEAVHFVARVNDQRVH